MRPYDRLSTRGQVAILRPLALELCGSYGISEPKLRLLNHGFNTTFAVTSRSGERFALRLNVNSTRGRAEIAAEIAWLRALAEETDLRVPQPLRLPLSANGSCRGEGAGGWGEAADRGVAEVHSEALGRTVFAAMYSWLPGPVGDSVPRPEVARALGEATVKLHDHASSWQIPEGCRFHPVRNIIFGGSLRFCEMGYPGDISVFQEVLVRATDAFDRLRVGLQQPIHYDLHFGNVKWHRGRLAVFDFDDAILGYPAMDVAVSLFYLRRYDTVRATLLSHSSGSHSSGSHSSSSGQDSLEAAYRQGLGRPIEAYGFDEADCETLIAARALGLANELYAMTTANLIAMAPKYAAITETRLRHFLHTGRFDPSVASMG